MRCGEREREKEKEKDVKEESTRREKRNWKRKSADPSEA